MKKKIESSGRSPEVGKRIYSYGHKMSGSINVWKLFQTQTGLILSRRITLIIATIPRIINAFMVIILYGYKLLITLNNTCKLTHVFNFNTQVFKSFGDFHFISTCFAGFDGNSFWTPAPASLISNSFSRYPL